MYVFKPKYTPEQEAILEKEMAREDAERRRTRYTEVLTLLRDVQPMLPLTPRNGNEDVDRFHLLNLIETIYTSMQETKGVTPIDKEDAYSILDAISYAESKGYKSLFSQVDKQRFETFVQKLKSYNPTSGGEK